MNKNKQLVVLIHGLFRKSSSMSKVEKNLLKHSYDVINIDYPSLSSDIAGLASIVVERIHASTKLDTYESVHFVTHSLGALLLRYISQEKLLNITGNTVMLAPPNHGAVIIDKAPSWRWLRKLLGEATFEMSTRSDSTANTLELYKHPLGIIAGSSSLNPIWSLITPKPNDSTVMVESTKLEGMLDHIVFPYVHSFIMNKKDVNACILHFLQKRTFR